MKKGKLVMINCEVHRKLKIKAAVLGQNLNELTNEILSQWVESHQEQINGEAAEEGC